MGWTFSLTRKPGTSAFRPNHWEELTLLLINYFLVFCRRGTVWRQKHTFVFPYMPSPRTTSAQGAHLLAKLFSKNKICPQPLVCFSRSKGANYVCRIIDDAMSTELYYQLLVLYVKSFLRKYFSIQLPSGSRLQRTWRATGLRENIWMIANTKLIAQQKNFDGDSLETS